MRKILLNVITVIGTIIAVVTGVYTIYHEAIENKSPLLSISIDNSERATRLSKVKGLEASYIFKNRKIKDFWIVDISIANTSNATIIGAGDKKNIIGDSLAMMILRPYHLLDAIFTQADFNDVSFRSSVDTVMNFKFIQWRPKEQIKLRLYIEGDTSVNEGPSFWMNDRQIIDGKISYEKPEKQDYKGFLPDRIKNTTILFGLGVIALFVFVEAFVIVLMLFVDYLFRLYKYRIWKKKYYTDYKLKVKELVADKVLLKEYEPYTLPDEFWPRVTDVPKPKKSARDNQIYMDFVLAALACTGTLIGALWIFPSDWVH